MLGSFCCSCGPYPQAAKRLPQQRITAHTTPMIQSMEGILQAESRNRGIPITSMIQSMGVIPQEGLRRRGIHTTSIKANTEDIQSER